MLINHKNVFITTFNFVLFNLFLQMVPNKNRWTKVEHFHHAIRTDCVIKKSPNRKNKPSSSSDAKRSKKSSTLTRKKGVLPTTNCPSCEKELEVHGLRRHMLEKHGGTSQFSCSLYDFRTNTNIQLMDHQRRLHFQQRKMGRPKKKEVRRPCSPFRVGDFVTRHSASVSLAETVVGKLS